VVRKLFIAAVSPSPKDGFYWSHTKTFLRVRSETYENGQLTRSEDRYFNTSVERDELTDEQWLALIRAHWRVENNCHWTYDAIFEEDNHPWIEMDPQGALAVLLLRRVAYNLLTLYRSVTQRSEDRRETPWKDLMRWFYNTAIKAAREHMEGLRPRKALAALS
jgi:hypothetical protein